MRGHFLILTIFAVFVSTAFALLMQSEPKKQLKFGILAFVSFVGSAFLIGWLMYPFPS